MNRSSLDNNNCWSIYGRQASIYSDQQSAFSGQLIRLDQENPSVKYVGNLTPLL
ncbi:MAG TPA: hypothetical protein V6C85_32450 [Allocoleopsis sp.]